MVGLKTETNKTGIIKKQRADSFAGILRPIFAILLLFLLTTPAFADNWRITAYCACKKCCGKTDAITASGKKAIYGYVACNWLPFGTKLHIAGMGDFIVMDRGAKSLFGSKTNPIKHLDIYMPTHLQARIFGNQYREVTILAKGGK